MKPDVSASMVSNSALHYTKLQKVLELMNERIIFKDDLIITRSRHKVESVPTLPIMANISVKHADNSQQS